MQYSKKELIEISLEKAKIALSDAEFSFINDRLYNAQNRIYYSIFYSVTALSYLFDNVTSKHSHLMAWFNQKFIHQEKIFDPFFFKFYKKAFENRRKSDYVFTWKPQKEEIEADLKNAKIFINLIEEFVQKNIDKL
jgi:uncharacterized protein (UPF0332 family)